MRIAVVSPFLDSRHGTERCIVEQIQHFLRAEKCEVHIYAQSVQDLEVVPWHGSKTRAHADGKAIWHRIPTLPGPHLLNFIWWYFANQFLRRFHEAFQSVQFDVVFSPGINCPDADAIVVHIVFHEFFRLVHSGLRLREATFSTWPVVLHRLLYYRLIMFLENRIYRNRKVRLAAVSRLTATELATHFERSDVAVIPNAVDLARFNPSDRRSRRKAVRGELQLAENEFVLLLVGNDWKKKGISALLDALGAIPEIPWRLIVVGRDDRTPYLKRIRALNLQDRILFLNPSSDILKFYAAADVYAGPSLHDSFALPPLEAMACGLPVITSSQNGGSQIITEGLDGFVLPNPEDSRALARLLVRLYAEPGFRQQMGENAAHTAESFTWQRNARETWAFVTSASRRKDSA
ncbi:MAG TPA: glycosyltransferase family 4 protein [Candidatus Eisenbacteria bacterium]|nr:glycosyltransferase family 4 protein [Candidatus Eisenbacteria bacterium]